MRAPAHPRNGRASAAAPSRATSTRTLASLEVAIDVEAQRRRVTDVDHTEAHRAPGAPPFEPGNPNTRAGLPSACFTCGPGNDDRVHASPRGGRRRRPQPRADPMRVRTRANEHLVDADLGERRSRGEVHVARPAPPPRAVGVVELGRVGHESTGTTIQGCPPRHLRLQRADINDDRVVVARTVVGLQPAPPSSALPVDAAARPAPSR